MKITISQMKIAAILILIACATGIVSTCNAQAVKVECKNGLGQYQQVIEVPGKSAKEIYDAASRWVLSMYANPQSVISGKLENEMIKGSGASSVKIALAVNANFTYVFTIDVKDDKARYTMSGMRVGDYTFETYVFKSDCSVRTNSQANSILQSTDEIANTLINSLSRYLNENAKKDDW